MTDLDMDEEKLRSNIAAFEAALAARETRLDEPPVRRVLLALDGSNQDETALKCAIHLAQRTGATVLPICAWETADRGRAEYLREQKEVLRLSGVTQNTIGDEGDIRPPYQQILEASQAADCDLIIIPAPYREDFDALGHESVGTNLDILLCRAPKSLLVVREPKAEPEKCFAKILLPITPMLVASAEAAAWAVRLSQKGGTLQILVVADRDVPAEGIPAHLRQESETKDSQTPETTGLIAAVQRRATEIGLACRVRLRSGEEVKMIVEEAETDDQLVILPCCPRDPAGAAFQRVESIIRLSSNPVLMV